MTQTFTPELCAHLSSLAPGFEGHWYYIEEDAYVGDGKYGKKVRIVCLGKDEELKLHQQVICPVWQVEDLLRNIFKIVENFKEKGMWKDGKIIFIDEIVYEISCFIAFNSFDTAYQKIEEYLWQILWINKEVLCCGGLGSITKGECGRGTKTGCVGMHCKCMQKDCSNMHYVDCREHYIHVEYLEK